MDLANNIVDSTERMPSSPVHADQNDKKFLVSVSMHGGRYVRDIWVLPTPHHVVIIFKKFGLKLSRNDSDAFHGTVDFLVDEIEEDILDALHADMESESYWPLDDEKYNKNIMTLSKGSEVVFAKAFDMQNLQAKLGAYLKNMRLVI
jgi:hypothetical protein